MVTFFLLLLAFKVCSAFIVKDSFLARHLAKKDLFWLSAASNHDYSSTVLLPATTFEQRANSATKEPQIQRWWEENCIFEQIKNDHCRENFVLHDGPPYANGNLHIGHALNKILKDFINRFQILQDRRVCYIPGWDCHGLPIELKVIAALNESTRQNLDPLKLRETAATYAQEAILNQLQSFKRYGIWADWNDFYTTMSPSYEAAQIRVFGEMVRKGHIYRGLKPVHWSPSSQTALAEAELEYPDGHRSRSIYVAFKVEGANAVVSTPPAYVAIWTTTPWTIPANLAVAVNPNLTYSIVRHPSILNGSSFLIAEDAIERLQTKFGLADCNMEHLNSFPGHALEGLQYRHPLNNNLFSVINGGDYITADSGTGLVHTAPGHGEEDYVVGLKHGLGILSPVDEKGFFTSEAGSALQGKDVLGEGNAKVIELLLEKGVLLAEESYQHKYPYDWRTKKPTIFRATDQWFASVRSFKTEALNAIDSVQWVPKIGRNRISSMVESRGDWCISRQRSWGVPIPVFYRTSTGEPLLTSETIDHIEQVFAKHGSDSWWRFEVSDLLPEMYRHLANEYVKGADTMDVWFDSGTSWAGVLKTRQNLQFPADLYLEGSDQSRGWFQSSLLTSVATTGSAPYKKVLTHGFVLDENGMKMSKSVGNVVDPKELIEGGKNQKEQPGYGADTLRLWVAGVDYTSDVCIGPSIMKQMAESYRKVRNTARFLLGNLANFDPESDIVKYDLLPSLDKYILGLLSKLVTEVEAAYDDFQFSKVYQLLMQFLVVDVSSFYFDVSKDRLYISSRDSLRRRSAQTVMNEVLRQLILVIAPILPHLAEEIWQNLPYDRPTVSVFQQKWKNRQVFPEVGSAKWNQLRELKDVVNKGIEKARSAKIIGAAQEAKISLWTNDEDFLSLLLSMKGDDDFLDEFNSTNGVDDLRFLLSVSEVHVFSDSDGSKLDKPFLNDSISIADGKIRIFVDVSKSDRAKCQRCWFHTRNADISPRFPHICPRCVTILDKKVN